MTSSTASYAGSSNDSSMDTHSGVQTPPLGFESMTPEEVFLLQSNLIVFRQYISVAVVVDSSAFYFFTEEPPTQHCLRCHLQQFKEDLLSDNQVPVSHGKPAT